MPGYAYSYNKKRQRALRQAAKKRLRDEFVTPHENKEREGQAVAESNHDLDRVSEPDAWAPPADGDLEHVDELPVGGEPTEEASDVDDDRYEEGVAAAEAELERERRQRDLFRVLEEEEREVEVDEEGPAVANAPVSSEQAVDNASKFFAGLQARREVPHAVLSDVVEYLRSNAESFSELLKTNSLPTYRSMRKKVLRSAPKVKLDVNAETEDGDIFTYENRYHFPKKDFEARGLRLIYTHYYVGLKAVKELHQNAHTTDINCQNIDMSLDGVPESKSSGLSIDVLSIRFHGCDNIYTVGIMQPAKKGIKGKDEVLLRPFLKELQETGLVVKRVIADAPKRAVLQGMKTHASTFGCHYCTASKVNGKFPSSTFGGETRTDAEIRRVAEALDAGEDVEARGVKGLSPLRGIRGLDLANDVPTEAMHLICLGIVRRMMRCSYNIGPKMSVAHKPADVEPLNRRLRKCKGLTNFPRRPRDFDPAVWKAHEYRNFILCYWPVLIGTAPKGTLKVWLLTVYLVRALCLPDSLYNRLDRNAFGTDLYRRWYVAFEKAFSVDQCTYNPHCFTHLSKVRALGPLSETSALRYEDHYNIIKKSYRAGTPSLGTQALQTSLLSTMIGHRCKPTYLLRSRVTSRVEDRYVYLNDGRMYMLTDVDGVGAKGRRVPNQRVAGLLHGLDFSDVLVFRVETDRIWRLEEAIDPSTVMGNVVVVDGYASVVLWSMLRL